MVPRGSPQNPPGAWDGVQPLPRPQEAARNTHGTRGLLLPAWSKRWCDLGQEVNRTTSPEGGGSWAQAASSWLRSLLPPAWSSQAPSLVLLVCK